MTKGISGAIIQCEKEAIMLEIREKVKYLYEEFKFRFEGKTNGQLYDCAKQEFRSYRIFASTAKEQRHLKAFAKEYFEFRNNIIETRNDLVEYKQSQQYKKDKFINKIRFNRELKKYYKLCDSVCEFEEMFYKEMGFSLLKVENERWLEELKLKEQSAIRYLN